MRNEKFIKRCNLINFMKEELNEKLCSGEEIDVKQIKEDINLLTKLEIQNRGLYKYDYFKFHKDI